MGGEIVWAKYLNLQVEERQGNVPVCVCVCVCVCVFVCRLHHLIQRTSFASIFRTWKS